MTTVTDIKELAARMRQTLDHAQATGPNPTSQRALEYRLAQAINALSSPRGDREDEEERAGIRERIAELTNVVEGQ